MCHVNEKVTVSAFYFATSFGQLKTFPRQIELHNKKLTFEDGFRYFVKKGQDTIQLFDMNDGDRVYRLRLENDNWTLIGTA